MHRTYYETTGEFKDVVPSPEELQEKSLEELEALLADLDKQSIELEEKTEDETSEELSELNSAKLVALAIYTVGISTLISEKKKERESVEKLVFTYEKVTLEELDTVLKSLLTEAELQQVPISLLTRMHAHLKAVGERLDQQVWGMERAERVKVDNRPYRVGLVCINNALRNMGAIILEKEKQKKTDEGGVELNN